VIFETRQGLFHTDMPVHRVESVAELCPVPGAKYMAVLAKPKESLNGHVDFEEGGSLRIH
jgi:hypothetical protein